MADTTYGPKTYRDNGGDRLNVISGGTLNVEAGATETHANTATFSGTLNASGTLQIAGTSVTATAAALNAAAGAAATPVIAAAGTTLVAANAGLVTVLNKAAADVWTLPAASAVTNGVPFTFTHQVATSSGVGHIIRPAGTDVMRGTDITTPAAAKGIMNTQATSHIGDSVVIVSDGVSAWYVIGRTGTWTREA